jgi:hypothetical protein
LKVAALIGSMIVALLLGAMPANAGTRVALVIGNSAYQNVPFLPNPVNDANDLSTSLKRLDFDVKTLTNARYDDMRRALIEFGQQARGAEIAVIFFAGHGIQIGGDNWLIPVDAQLATDLNVANETIGLQSLTRAVSNTTKLGLVMLDACRSNPFLPKMQSTNLSRAVDRGFSRVEPSDNVLVAYAARDGTTASDGSGRNSPFTNSLLKNIETPGLEVRFLFANIRDDVMAATRREQQPFVYGSLSRDMIFLKAPLDTAIPIPQGGGSLADPPNLASPMEHAIPSSQSVLGLELAEISQELRARYNIKNGVKGVVITNVESSSDAAKKSLKAGDVVVEVFAESVATATGVQNRVNDAKKDYRKKSVLFLVSNNNGELRYVALDLMR